jgi:endogenous inhibitor of DNA gyrase (YacG/DUF329 family)
MEIEKYIKENDGRIRLHTLVKCARCKKDFYKKKRFIKKSKNHFCTKECSSVYYSEQNSFIINCSYCNKEVKKRNSRKNKSKSGFFFCSRKCKDNAQKVHGNNRYEEFLDMMPSHFGTGDGSHGYRKIALQNYGKKCRICDYDIVEVLQVHHKDCDRSNNSLENLDVLCPTHHWEYHMGVRKY